MPDHGQGALPFARAVIDLRGVFVVDALILQGFAAVDVQKSFVAEVGGEETAPYLERVARILRRIVKSQPEISSRRQGFERTQLGPKCFAIRSDREASRDCGQEALL